MNNKTKNLEIIPPINQLYLYGYEHYFNSFIKLYNKDKLPNVILLSGPKGSGKATFAYHFINFMLSDKEQDKYSVNNFFINPNNKSYKDLCNFTHPNFFLLENKVLEENIKIENIRQVLKFLSKSTFNTNIKIVLIDNAEYLNVNSSNALLKELEEPRNNTYFFIIHNSISKILDTIKSRSIEFKFFFSLSSKKNIFKNIIKQYLDDFNEDEINENFYFETPGNIIKYLSIFNDTNTNIFKDKLSCINYLVDKYKHKKDPQLLIFISSLIELFYKDLSLKNNKKLNTYFHNKFKILKNINDMKKFNLDKNNLLISLLGILKNES